MLNEANKERCRRIVGHYGYRPQLGMVIEECSELIKATCKTLRNGTCATEFSENFKEELADVVAMCEQARQMANVSEAEINSRVEAKLENVIARFKGVSRVETAEDNNPGEAQDKEELTADSQGRE